ncbi:WxL domain-containing protein [Carnobacterium gallinarum]|uniref:WxL domain-containing protein n=1 Tax=Carnobacterium gallinarum TaxID=2749 RepID=UPI00054D3BCB|nr:WxL domain-containing protein [Carnobacterium gallinarum]
MKLTKVVLTTLLASTALIGAALPVQAATFPASTDGIVNFKDADGTAAPVDPTEEGKEPVKPVPPTSTSGLLRFDQVPTLNFGTVEIKGEEVTQAAQYVRLNDEMDAFKKYTPAYLQITDERGSNAGWSVNLKASSFSAYADVAATTPVAGVEDLIGAEISMKSAKVKSHSNVGDALKPTVVTSTLALNENAQTVLSAGVGKGMGIWSSSFYKDETGTLTAPPFTTDEAVIPTDDTIELKIPGTAKKSKDYTYKSTLEWVLSDTPDTTVTP